MLFCAQGFEDATYGYGDTTPNCGHAEQEYEEAPVFENALADCEDAAPNFRELTPKYGRAPPEFEDAALNFRVLAVDSH